MAKNFTGEEFKKFIIDQLASVRRELEDMRSKTSGMGKEIENIETTLEPLAEAFNKYRED